MGILDRLRHKTGSKRLNWHCLEPAPLIDAERGYCLFFSNKAGCTTLAKWFFRQTGHLEAALDYHRWIHHYRIQVYCQNDGYLQSLKRLAAGEFHVAKLVRSPYSRAVSSYLHAVKTVYIDQDMSRFLGRAINPVSRFSFEEFVDYMESTGVTHSDLHHRRQCIEAEISGVLGIHRLLKLENLQKDLATMERDFSLQQTDLRRLSESPHHNKHSERSHQYCGNRVYSRIDAQFPPFADFYDRVRREKIRDLYQDDFRLYGYDASLT